MNDIYLVQENEDFPLSDYEKAPEIFINHETKNIMIRDYKEKENVDFFEMRFKRLKENAIIYLRSNKLRIKEGKDIIKESGKKKLQDKEKKDVKCFSEQIEKQKKYINSILSSFNKIDKEIKKNDLSFTDKFNVFKDEIKNVVINFEKANKLNHILKHNQEIIYMYNLRNGNKSIMQILKEKQEEVFGNKNKKRKPI